MRILCQTSPRFAKKVFEGINVEKYRKNEDLLYNYESSRSSTDLVDHYYDALGHAIETDDQIQARIMPNTPTGYWHRSPGASDAIMHERNHLRLVRRTMYRDAIKWI